MVSFGSSSVSSTMPMVNVRSASQTALVGLGENAEAGTASKNTLLLPMGLPSGWV